MSKQISDEDWAIISSSSDVDEESTASSLAETSPDVGDPDTPDSKIDSMPDSLGAEDSISTIRQTTRGDKGPTEEGNSKEMTQDSTPLASERTKQKCGGCVVSRIDRRMRDWSSRGFQILFAQKLESMRSQLSAKDIQSVGLLQHTVFSLYSTLEHNQEVLLYYLTVFISGLIFFVGQYISSVIAATPTPYIERKDTSVFNIWAKTTEKKRWLSQTWVSNCKSRSSPSRLPISHGVLEKSPFFSQYFSRTRQGAQRITQKYAYVADKMGPFWVACSEKWQRSAQPKLSVFVSLFTEGILTDLRHLKKVSNNAIDEASVVWNSSISNARYLMQCTSASATATQQKLSVFLSDKIAHFQLQNDSLASDVIKTSQETTIVIKGFLQCVFNESRQVAIKSRKGVALLVERGKDVSTIYFKSEVHQAVRDAKDLFNSLSRKTYRILWAEGSKFAGRAR
ncbi:predicted protein [Clavispora lusitaniae ATCC 42720]|uniref:Uncharacterized protein n=1 Tax=Clavispora lusitaniae (strain ATCC 42720) TaxID=306902 RepID=C4XVV5_CLAL4|nr:uncharacterized protein CLUG_00074 [Clavispora lusitaniae ATCC 42720]EEQ35951.1 predicted protein [Clavispora lusitaniae ATCC 42720]